MLFMLVLKFHDMMEIFSNITYIHARTRQYNSTF